MRRLLVIALVVAACTPGSSEPAPTTVSGTTTSFVFTTTTVPPLAVEIDDCSAPQVTFSPLCETYKIIQEWHVDRPVDPVRLADAARSGLQNWTTDETADRPRTLVCAIPDPSFAELCGDLATRVEKNSIPIGAAVEAAVLNMVDFGLDPFSYYLPPDEVGAFRSNGVVEGVGILLDATNAVGSKCAQITDVCQLKVVYVLEDNPAAAAGLAPGDVIIAVDGEPVLGLGFVDTAIRIAGDASGSVLIQIDREGESIEFDILRSELVVPTVEAGIAQPGVGYIRIPDFEDDIPDLVYDGLSSMLDQPIDTIVIDLRDNGGGLVEAAIDVLSEFVDGETVLRTVGPDEDLEYPAASGGIATSQRLIILVNQGTASAAEIMAAALRDTRNAYLIGTDTFGKDAVQIAFELRNGGEFYVAVARWLSPSEASVGARGLTPDQEVELPASLSTEELVERALESTK